MWRYGDRDDGRRVRTFPGGVTPMVLFATVLVGAEILALTFVGSKVWAGIYQTPADPGSLQIDVQSEQFAFYFRYAGADGAFGATHPELINEANENYFGLDPAHDVSARDDIVVPTLTIPVNRPVALTLRAKDVGHAFYVPELRIQQDFVPGLAIPLHFTATRTGKYEIGLPSLASATKSSTVEVTTRYGNRTPLPASSTPTEREKAICACLEALYAPEGPAAIVPATDAMLTRSAGAPASSAGRNACRHQTEPR